MPISRKAKDSRSRNSTPAAGDSTDQSAPNSATTPATLSYSDLLDRYCRGSSPPPSSVLKRIAEELRALNEDAKERSERCDRGMREFSQKRKELFELVRREEIEEAARQEELRREELRKEQAKKEEEDRPLAVGAHRVARQDGEPDEDASVLKTSQSPAPPVKAASPAASSTSTESHQPRPIPAVPQAQTFGDDPSTFDDPTIYHIRDLLPDLTDDEKRDILCVKEFPHTDLHDLTPGTPPDRDFSNAKPPTQVTAVQFANYLEPYVRPLTTEDTIFLEERGDRNGPFLIPRRGARSYHQVWAEEDGHSSSASASQQVSTNQPSGSIEQMNDTAAESGEISTGPVLARLLGALLPERRAPPADPTSAITNGDTSGSQFLNGDMDPMADHQSSVSQPLPPATHMAESTQPGWKAAPPKVDYKTMDERVLAELRHIGFIQEDAVPDYEGHHDDEVAARLRYLQEELQRVAVVNGARKARVLELAQDRMAQQEFSSIADDLDTQLNQAWLKRHRNSGKAKKVLKRPGGPGANPLGAGAAAAGAAGVGRPGLGEPLRALLERRQQWNEILGPIVNGGHTEVPGESIFDKDNMTRLMAREQEAWADAAE